MVEAFKEFPNLLGFFSGNEIINEDSVIQVPAYIRAVTRDLKDYITKNAKRSIPVGYSAADVRPLLASTWAYLSCNIENSTSSKIDFFGLNSYSWCGNSTFQESGYDQLVAQFSNTTIPVFFSEYGCNNVYPRIFTEVPVLYGPLMTGVLSGGLIYEYSQEVSNYGLVNLNNNNTASLLHDYINLQTQYDKLNIAALEQINSTATSLQPPTCDQSLINAPNFDDGFDIPVRPDGVQAMIDNGVKVPHPGALVTVTQTTVSSTVYNINGQPITGLKLNILPEDDSNTPNASGNLATGTTTSSSPSSLPSRTKTSGAVVGVENRKLNHLILCVLTLAVLGH